METKLPIESPNAERPPICESPCMVTASGQREFELAGNPTMPQSGLQWPRPSKVATNKAIWVDVHCKQQTPFCPPEKQVKSPGAALTRMTACCYKVKPCSFLFPWSKEWWENPPPLGPLLVSRGILLKGSLGFYAALSLLLRLSKLCLPGERGHRNTGPTSCLSMWGLLWKPGKSHQSASSWALC